MDILSNPELMSKISAMASSASPTERREEPRQELPKEAFNPQAPIPNKSNKADLLLAIKPLLKSEKQTKIDAIIKAITVATAVSKLKGGANDV